MSSKSGGGGRRRMVKSHFNPSFGLTVILLLMSLVLSLGQSLFLVNSMTQEDSQSEVHNNDGGTTKYSVNKPVIMFLGSRGKKNSLARLLAENDEGLVYKIDYDEDAKIVSLSCWANYPVTWDFDGPLGMIIEGTNLTRNSSEMDVWNESSYRYTAVVNVRILRKGFTGIGNYTCSSISKTNQSSSIYLYGNEKSSPAFLRPSEVLNVSTLSQYKGDGKLILPCRVNNPHVKPFLSFFKEGKYYPIEEYPQYGQYKIQYKASTGFEISSRSPINLSGEFRCEIRNTSNHQILDFMRINVVQHLIEKMRERSPDLLIEKRNYGNCHSFICRLKSERIPSKWEDKLEISLVECGNPMHCKLASTSVYDKMEFSEYNKDDCTPVNDIPSYGVSIEVNLQEIKSGVILCRTKDKKYFQTLEYFEPIQGPSNENSSIIVFDEEKTMSHPTDPRILRFDIHNRTFYVNEIIEIYCNASTFLFSNGLQFLFQFKNGSIQQPVILSNSIDSGIGFTLRESKIKMTSGDLVKVICLAPVWNSSQWGNITLDIRVVDGTLPKITEISQPETWFGGEDVNKSLLCEANGVPRPDILWYKDDQPFIDETQNSHVQYDTLKKEKENVTISHLFFNKVAWNSSNVGGRFYCNATNAKGTTIQFITVKIEGNSSWKIWTSSVSLVVLCLVVILVFYLHKFWKKSESQGERVKDLIRQLNAKEIDEFKFGRRQVSQQQRLQRVDDGKELAMYLRYDADQYEIQEEDLILDEDEVDRKLGEGNYGIVVKGMLIENTGNRVPVAVKMLRSWNVVEATALLSELKILSYVGKHPNVVSLIGAITNFEQGKIQVIIEYCAMRSLELYLRQKRGVFLNELDGDKISYSQSITEGSNSDYVKIDYAIKTIDLVRWSYQCANGMAYLASRKIIHGDLAARNLLLTETRDLKISDFGLSKKLTNYTDNYIPSEKPSSEQRDQPWRTLALEYWFDSKKFSTQSDVWAFGVTLWEIFSLGEIPYREWKFGSEFVTSLASGYRMEKPNYANSQIHSIMLECWEEKPYQRPTFTQLADWFKNMLPENYTSSIQMSMSSYQPSEITPMNLEYIYGEELEQFQFHGEFQDC